MIGAENLLSQRDLLIQELLCLVQTAGNEIPAARRVLGEGNELTLRMRLGYAAAIYFDAGATLDDLREAVTTLEETERAARRVLGGAHPTTAGTGEVLQEARAALSAREG